MIPITRRSEHPTPEDPSPVTELSHGSTPMRIYVALGAVAIACYFLLPDGQQLVWYDFFGVYAVAALVIGTVRHKPAVRSPWFVLAGALSCLVAGDVTLNRYAALFGSEPGFPNIADLFFIGGNLGVVAALWLILRRRLPERDHGSAVDALIIATAAGVLSWIFLMAPYANDPALTDLQRLVSLCYPSTDVLMLVMLARMLLGGGSRTPAFWLIAGALSAGMVADTVFAALMLEQAVPPPRGHWVDAGWLIWYACFGAAALHPSMRTVTEEGPVHPVELTRRRLAMLTIFALIVPAAGLFEAIYRTELNSATIALGSCALFLLVIWRMRGLLRNVESARDRLTVAVDRERVLRGAAASLVAATDREEIYAAVTTAIRGLVGEEASIRILEGAPESLSVVSATGLPGTVALAELHLPQPAVPALRSGRVDLAGEELSRLLRKALLLPANGPIRMAPLVSSGETCGALLVGGTRRAAADDDGWMEALASNLSLALERATLAERLHARRSEERFRSLVRNSSDIIFICDAEGTIRYVSPSIERVLGFIGNEVVGVRAFDLIHPEDQQSVRQVHHEVLSAPGATRAYECRMRDHNGSWQYVEAIKTNLLHDESIRGLVVNVRDISERKLAEERLAYQAFHDPLTDLPNRALFMDRLHHSLARAARRSECTGVIFMDLDRFKVVNDSLGHEAGDRLLQIVARRLQAAIRSGDTAARIGGDEFTILLEDIENVTDAIEVAERITAALRRPCTIDGRDVFVDASLGITASRSGHHEALDLLRESDIAMYQAKANGAGGYAVFDAAMGAAALRRLETETNLRHAIDRGEFELHYQPALDLRTGRVESMEALIRWRHGDRGLIPPADFVPMAEETGLIVPIGLWVLEEACRQAARWRNQLGEKAPGISVNLSAKQLLHDDIVADIAGVIRATGIEPRTLTLEITETFAVTDAEANRTTLQRLKGLGVRLAIDDFGKGYSSLGYLRRLPVDVLKIDRSFVQALGNDPDDTLIISAVSNIAHNLGMVVVAEGIEEASLVERVRSLGCDLGQGYFFAQPLPAPLATAFLELEGHTDALIASTSVA